MIRKVAPWAFMLICIFVVVGCDSGGVAQDAPAVETPALNASDVEHVSPNNNSVVDLEASGIYEFTLRAPGTIPRDRIEILLHDNDADTITALDILSLSYEYVWTIRARAPLRARANYKWQAKVTNADGTTAVLNSPNWFAVDRPESTDGSLDENVAVTLDAPGKIEPLGLASGDRLNVQWTSAYDAGVSEYRIALRDFDRPEVDLGYQRVASRGVRAAQSYSVNADFFDLQEGRRYFVAVWAHGPNGEALDSTQRGYVYRSGALARVESTAAKFIPEEGNASLSDGRVQFPTDTSADWFPDSPVHFLASFRQASHYIDLGGFRNGDACARYIVLYPMGNAAFTINADYSIDVPAGGHVQAMGFVVPAVEPGQAVALELGQCHSPPDGFTVFTDDTDHTNYRPELSFPGLPVGGPQISEIQFLETLPAGVPTVGIAWQGS